MKPQTRRRVGRWLSFPWRFAVGLWRFFDPDERDALFFGGLALLATGLWLVWPPVSFIACGLVLVIYSIMVAQ